MLGRSQPHFSRIDRQAFVDHAHKRTGQSSRALVLDNISSINNPGRTLLKQATGPFEEHAVGNASATPDEDGNAAGRLNDAMVDCQVVSGISLDDIGTQFGCLADERDDALLVTIHHIAASLGVWPEDQWLDHHGHAVTHTDRLEAKHVSHALFPHLGLVGDLKEIDANTRRIEAHGLLDGIIDDMTVEPVRKLPPINIRNIYPQNQRRFEPTRTVLEKISLPCGQLDGVRSRCHNGVDRPGDIFDAR